MCLGSTQIIQNDLISRCLTSSYLQRPFSKMGYLHRSWGLRYGHILVVLPLNPLHCPYPAPAQLSSLTSQCFSMVFLFISWSLACPHPTKSAHCNWLFLLFICFLFLAYSPFLFYVAGVQASFKQTCHPLSCWCLCSVPSLHPEYTTPADWVLLSFLPRYMPVSPIDLLCTGFGFCHLWFSTTSYSACKW